MTPIDHNEYNIIIPELLWKNLEMFITFFSQTQSASVTSSKSSECSQAFLKITIMSGIKIEVRDEQRKPLIEFFKQRETEILHTINYLQGELEGIRENLKTLGSEARNGTPVTVNAVAEEQSKNQVETEFRKNWSLPAKVKFLLKVVGHPAGTGELADLLINKFEPDIERRRAVASISSVLTGKSSKKHFIKKKDDRNQVIYELA